MSTKQRVPRFIGGALAFLDPDGYNYCDRFPLHRRWLVPPLSDGVDGWLIVTRN